MNKDSGSSGVGIETARDSAARNSRTGFTQKLLQKRSLTAQEAKTTLVGESPFSDLHATRIMTNSVQLTHGFGRVKFGTALRGLVLDTDDFGPVLDVHQVDLDQPGLDKSHAAVGIAGCSNIFCGKGVPQSSSRGQFVCSFITVRFKW